ncbi:hypothetical protein LOKO_00317 [Halomonas chromatireducens]|uniref:Uncharacterized protein n=1 Tax=Halomonas chromatireducens TaxID=507626 RepID=A0A0X8HB53_9GAMM|nr:hypothetical protein LOKO_00317 [Halomonas chromatireducens]
MIGTGPNPAVDAFQTWLLDEVHHAYGDDT